jgi:ABC-type lipoprotein release transport system permease subunit
MIARLALRSLRTNRWRSLLTGLGVAVGVAILICASGYLLGLRWDMVRGATAPELGQVSVANREYVQHPLPRHILSLGDGLLEKIRAVPGVQGASARVKVFGLIGTENRSVVTRIIGVDADHEARVTVARQGLQQGHWLSGGAASPNGAREVVIGYKLAEQLGAAPGSELVSFFEAADGSLGNDLLRVTGVLRTNVANLDGHTAFMNLTDLQYAAALEGKAHEVAVKIADVQDSGGVAQAISDAVERPDVLTRPWQKVRPEIAQTLELMSELDGFMYGFVYLIVALGLFSAQRMSALERRREFAMMLAIGMGPGKLFAVVLLETLAVVALGGLGGALLGAAVTQYFAVNGFDWTALAGNESVNFQYMGVSFSQRLHFGLTTATVFGPLLTLIPVALLCGLWPSWQAARTDLRTALSGRS